MQRLIASIVMIAMTAGLASAKAPEASLRPMPRPQTETVAPILTAAAMSLRPKPRPMQAAQPAPATAQQPQVAMSFVAPAQAEPARRTGFFANMFRPKARPPEQLIAASAVRVRPGKALVQSRKGSVCGDPSIRGETLAPIVGKLRGCGIDDPVRITSVDGVKLSMAATVDCGTATALKSWVQRGLRPAMGNDEPVLLEIAGAYTCRSRNNVRGAPLSEHSRGKAIDVSGITLASGKTVSVAQDWRKRDGKPLQAAYRAACGVFGTTLGPGSDGYHEDHLHFDTIARRQAYCH